MTSRKRKFDQLDLSDYSSGAKRQKLEVKNLDERRWEDWISASSTYNYLINDPLLDLLNKRAKATIGNTTIGNVPPTISKNSDPDSFTEFILKQGRLFETRFIQILKARHGVSSIVDINGNLEARSTEKVKATLEAMNRGVPIIYSGVLHNEDNKTYGVPDLLVRSDWLKKIVNISPVKKKHERLSAKNLRFKGSNKVPAYHYRVVDIKFTTLYLRANGINLLNRGSIPAFKGQLYIYNKALGKVQGYEPPQAYILGRRWCFTSLGETYRNDNCLDRYGVIDFSDADLKVKDRVNDAIRWLLDMRRNEGGWDLSRSPLPRPELYPNMSNTHDYPWHSTKRDMASNIKEITSLWMCGVKNRCVAHSQNIFSWTDPRCCAEALGVKGEKTSVVLDKLIDINRPSTTTLISPTKIKNNESEWQSPKPVEFYIDFEYVNDVVDDFSKLPFSQQTGGIFMLGVGYYAPSETEKIWVYKSFTVDKIASKEEKRVCGEFSDYIKEVSRRFHTRHPLLIHWSNAENAQWSHVYDSYDGYKKSWIPTRADSEAGGRIHGVNPIWFDLLKLFKAEPIVIKGCMNFGLKDVATAMGRLGFIKTGWDASEGSVGGGLAAMMGAIRANKEAISKQVLLREVSQMREIIKYNEVDCKVMGEIIGYLRRNHI